MARMTKMLFVAAVALPVVIAVTPAPIAGGASTDVVFNEILYHPEDDNPAGEFFELFNRGSSRIDLTGWCVDGIKYCFPAGSHIDGKGYVVVTSASYNGALSNGGEELTLIDRSGATVEQWEYDDKRDWPAMADGEGMSLQRLDVTSPANDPGNWRADSPSPGVRNRVRSAPMPVWSDVDHTVLPAPGAPIAVTADVRRGTSAILIYRIGFGSTVSVAVPVVDGAISTTIPGQAAGALVRYRLLATSSAGVQGTWPRQGDGATYTGTTVAIGPSTDLPRFEWFMPDADYNTAVRDLTLHGDDGYPAIFAYRGEIFDNTRVRVKGATSRYHPKKKWKFILPAGHELDIPGVFPEKVDEFALHSNWSDKSFLRETIASEAFGAAGMPVSQAFPVQLERNGQFYGLYTYVEQPDGTWRDRWGIDEGSVYEAGGGNLFGLLAARDAFLSESVLRRKYEKETNEFEDDSELRELITVLNSTSGSIRRAWIMEHVDVPSVVNTLAASAVFQHQDYGHKNYRLVYSQLGRWTVITNDFDLTFGHRYNLSCAAECDFVGISGAFIHPGGPLFDTFWFDPVLVELVRQRMRTITEEILNPPALGARVIQLRDLTADEALRDRAIWGTYGAQKLPADDANDMISRFIVPQYDRVLGTLTRQGLVAPTSTPATPRLEVSTVQYDSVGGIEPHVTITNLENRLVDLSSYRIDELDDHVPGGMILRPGQSMVLLHEDSGSVAATFKCCVLAGIFGEDLDDLQDGFTLRNRAGVPVASWTQMPPGQMSVISGTPNRSAVISLTSSQAAGAGFLQVLDCGTKPGATANVNTDAPRQDRAGAAIVRFDAAGEACVYNARSAHVIADIQGYLAESVIDDVADVRLIDTRETARPRAGSQTRIVGRPNSSAVLAVVAVDTSGPGYLQVLSCGAKAGRFANVVFDGVDQTRSALAVVRLDAAGEACVFASTATNIVVDVQAYLTDGSVDDFADRRVLDTRSSAKPGAGSLTRVTGRPNSSGVAAVYATQTAGAGYLQVVPCAATPGKTANVVYEAALQDVGSLAILPFDAAGEVCIYTSMATHIVVDLQAYLTDGAFEDIADARLIDTRTD